MINIGSGHIIWGENQLKNLIKYELIKKVSKRKPFSIFILDNFFFFC